MKIRTGFQSLLILFCLFFSDASIYAQDWSGTPDPLRFEAEIRGFEQWDEKNSAPENALLFAGSSSIRFWKTAEAFPEYTVINRGFGGSHITDLLNHYDRVIGRFSLQGVVLYIGENDIASGMALHHVFEDYQELTGRILADYPNAHIIVITLKPSSSRLEHSERFTAFNRMRDAYNRASRRIHTIDLASPLVRNGRPDDSYFAEDRLHLNDRGYELWTERLGAFLSQLEEEGISAGKINSH